MHATCTMVMAVALVMERKRKRGRREIGARCIRYAAATAALGMLQHVRTRPAAQHDAPHLRVIKASGPEVLVHARQAAAKYH